LKKPDDYFTQSETVKCEQGNQALAIKLAEEITAAGGSLFLSSPVRSVDIGKDLVTVMAAGGRKAEVDYAVLAIPPSVWPLRTAAIQINPPIPSQFYMSMGVAVKYLSKMSARFWFADGLSPNAVSDSIGMTWDGTDNQLQLEGQTVALSLFAGGPAAKSALNVFDPPKMEKLRAFYVSELKKIYKDYPRYVLDSPQFICWPNDPWTQAGYSCPAPGEVTRIGPFLNDSFNDCLFFAGEHCCLPFFGYMEGALQSGTSAASRVLRNESLI